MFIYVFVEYFVALEHELLKMKDLLERMYHRRRRIAMLQYHLKKDFSGLERRLRG